ncbi:DUF4148 domain-containing protein [Paraburkholderia sp.]|uniref:DUF4148 domain-containing protein n=1 Tax=Paraburkholderia sp. TaxID=1926495 RepID=UPI003D6ECD11
MKLVQSLVVAVAIVIPALSFAQTNHPLTRAEVRAELVELQKAGYNPSTDYTQYPANIQAAEARLSAQKGVTSSSYGPSTAGTSASGSRVSQSQSESEVIGLGPIYAKP